MPIFIQAQDNNVKKVLDQVSWADLQIAAFKFLGKN